MEAQIALLFKDAETLAGDAGRRTQQTMKSTKKPKSVPASSASVTVAKQRGIQQVQDRRDAQASRSELGEKPAAKAVSAIGHA